VPCLHFENTSWVYGVQTTNTSHMKARHKRRFRVGAIRWRDEGLKETILPKSSFDLSLIVRRSYLPGIRRMPTVGSQNQLGTRSWFRVAIVRLRQPTAE
jgi:hypothetical protein